MMRWPRLRLWLLVAAFACGQLFMLAHAAGHDAAAADDAAHACLLCVAGHDLGTPAPTAAGIAWPALALAADVPPVLVPLLCGAIPCAPLARGPPHA